MKTQEIEHIFEKYPKCLESSKRLANLLNDLIPTEPKIRHVIEQAYNLDITKKIDTCDVMDNVLKNNLIRQMEETYGTDLDSAEWSILFWFKEYGENLSHKRNEATTREIEISKKAELAQKKKKRVMMSLRVAAVAVIAIAIFVVYLNLRDNRPVIHLNKYINVKYDGFDTIGTASYEIDYKAIDADFTDKLFLNSSSDVYTDLNRKIKAGTTIGKLLSDNYIKGKLDKKSLLSNGDKITFVWDIDEEKISQDFDIRVKYSKASFSVTGLEKLELFDPYSNMIVETSGTSPFGKVKIKRESKKGIYSLYDFKADKDSGLSNGDSIVISVTYKGDEESFRKAVAEDYHMGMSSLQTEYKVSGMKYYPESIEEVPENCIETLDNDCTQYIKDNAAKWKDERLLKNATLYKKYLLCKVDQDKEKIENRLFLVYKVTCNIDLSDKDKNYDKDVDYYVSFEYKDVKFTEDNEIDFNPSKYAESKDSFKYDTGESDFLFFTYTYSFTGYKDIKSLDKKLIYPFTIDGFIETVQ